MKARRITVWALGVLLLVSGCDLFRTRPTEPPQDGGSPWIYPIQADQVFANMVQAMAERNADHYLRCFFAPDDPGGTYLFVPNPNTTGWPLSLPWGYAEESQTITYLFSLLPDKNPPFLTFQEENRVVYGNNDSVRVRQAYNLVVPFDDPGQPLPSEVSGKSEFLLAQNGDGYWAILRWEDVEGSPSWTDLKAGLY
ncbi:MAG: hypothetical protein C4524_13240 [Candidatus Zixiibacteriota bacterium]|nr:MAG: hypothetical protein C4524_13240 [candidate division Zixibacteria bacterium]